MRSKSSEKGQALIIITFAAVVLMGFAALAIDGARVFEDKRHAQNAADTAALGAALAYSREQNLVTAAQTRATENGYDNNGTTNIVTITITDIDGSVCPANLQGKEIQVDIESTIGTTFARVLGRNTMTTLSTAVARACGTYSGPPFGGNAIVSLKPTGTAIGGNGNVNIDITGGGFFSNSSGSPSVDCDGASGSLSVPEVTIAGGTADYGNCGTTIPGGTDTSASQFTLESASAFFPPKPPCTGGAATSLGGGYYETNPANSYVGNTISLPNSDVHLAPGTYCITTSPGQFTHTIYGDEVFLYSAVTNFTLSFQGSGAGMVLTAPSSGTYKGILVYLKEQFDSNGNLICPQEIELHGNGAASIRGAVIAPSAEVNITGNPSGGAYQSQVIGCTVDIGGTSDVFVQYDPSVNFQTTVPYSISLLE